MESEPVQLHATLALCMIAKNEGTDLRRALTSVKDVVHEIIVVDTGSSDDTREVAKEFGATVLDYNHETHPESFLWDTTTETWFLADFAGARNFGWDAATCDYIMWLDADDIVVNPEGVSVSLLMATQHDCESVWAALDVDAENRLWRDRMVKRGSKRWVGRIHEVLMPAETGRKARTDFFHVRQCVREGITAVRVPHRNYQVLKHIVDTDPAELDNSRMLFYLARECRLIDLQESIRYFRMYLEKSTYLPERALAWLDFGGIYEHLQDWDEVEKVYSDAIKEPGKFPEAWFGRARAAYHQERWEDCIEYSRKGFELGNESIILIDRPLARLHDPHHFYNVALWMSEDARGALESCYAGLKIRPAQALQTNLDFYTSELKAAGLWEQFAPVTKYAVCVVEPKDYEYVGVFADVAQGLVEGLEELGYDVELTTDPYRLDRKLIVLGAHLLPPNAPDLPRDAIIYNLEQVGPDMPGGTVYLNRLRQHEIWDYSKANVETLSRGTSLRVKHVPIGCIGHLGIYRSQHEFDVLFVGSINERRQKIIDELRARGLTVWAVTKGFGEERDALLPKAKICLNVHFYDTKIFEIVRVSHWLANECFVISEDSVDAESYRDMLVFAPYEELVDRCVQYIDDPVVRKGIAKRGYLEFSRDHSWTQILKKALGEANEVSVSEPLPRSDEEDSDELDLRAYINQGSR